MGHRWVSQMVPACLLVAALAGCGVDAGNSSGVSQREILQYVSEVEPFRLAVNQLLDRADPILSAYQANRLTPAKAQEELGQLERSFGKYAVDIAAIAPQNRTLQSIHRPYAQTYVLEDTYLSALVAALPGRDFADLPNTQNAQRRAIIQWRIDLEVLARPMGTKLPGDLEAAGRGEIAPSPGGS